MRTHKATIYTVCYMFSKDQDEVADLFQECLINLWSSWPNFEWRSDVRTWIYRISLNVCVILVLAIYWQTGIFDHELSGAGTKGLISSAVGIVIGLIICFGFYFCEMHRVNQSVSEIDELTTD